MHRMAEGVRLVSVGRRLGGYLLDLLLAIVTLLIGWLIWSLIVWSPGQSPGEQVLGMYCVKLSRGRRATWGTICVREIVGRLLIMRWNVNPISSSPFRIAHATGLGPR